MKNRDLATLFIILAIAFASVLTIWRTVNEGVEGLIIEAPELNINE